MAEDKMIPHFHMLIIGGSAGSLEIVLDIIHKLDRELNVTVIIVLHRKSSNDSSLAYLLSDKTEWPVREVEDKDPVLAKHIYLAPGDYHLLVEKENFFSLDDSEKINYSRPSIDASFESAADAFGEKVTAVLLSGANADGVEGLQKIKSAGGACIVQNPDTAEVSYMPRQAILHAQVDHIIDGNAIGAFLNTLFG